jgi:hypothetical protein
MWKMKNHTLKIIMQSRETEYLIRGHGEIVAIKQKLYSVREDFIKVRRLKF